MIVLVALAAGDALACPSCAGSNTSYAAVFPVLIGFISVPFLVLGLAAAAMWRLRRSESNRSTQDS